MSSAIKYPSTRRDESVVTDMFGTKVKDPYRWLEDPDSQETKVWVNEQNKVTQDYLSTVPEGMREKFEGKIKHLLNYDRYSSVWKKGSYYYYFHHVALANQAVLMQSDSLDTSGTGQKDGRVFLDPNTMSKDGLISLASLEWSHNGEYLTYGIHRGGSDWEEFRIMNCHTLKEEEETIEWAKFTSIAWHHNGTGFYYMRYPTPKSLRDAHAKDKRGSETDEAVNHMMYYHTVGTPQSEDRVVLGADPAHPKRMYGVQVTLDGKYLLITASEDCSPKNQVWYVDLSTHFGNEEAGIVKFIDDSYDAQFSCIANDDDEFYFNTNWDAPRNRIIRARLGTPPSKSHDEVVPQHAEHVLTGASVVNSDQLALTYMQDAHDRLAIHELRSGAHLFDVALPGIGSVSVTGRRQDSFLMYKFTSFLYAGTIYYLDLLHPQGDGARVFRVMNPPGFDPSLYETSQHFFTSKDGTRVPMFVIQPRAPASAPRPCLYYAYGGFMISLTPSYSGRWASWMECLGGAVAIANIRGGNEYGKQWHDQGIVHKKQNVFDDFQAGARFLCDDLAITSKSKMLCCGGSNGGLLVGACINQAPSLFAAAVAQVGVMDMLRFHKFTIGSAWVSDFGSPEKEDEFHSLLKYSPLHNVFSPDDNGTPYPAVLLTTADHDDRVVPCHSLKFGAQLQYTAGPSKLQQNPLLLRVDVNAGHGQGKSLSMQISEIVDTWLFAANALKVTLSESS